MNTDHGTCPWCGDDGVTLYQVRRRDGDRMLCAACLGAGSGTATQMRIDEDEAALYASLRTIKDLIEDHPEWQSIVTEEIGYIVTGP